MTKNAPKFNIANKLLGWFLLVALVPLVTVGYISYQNSAIALKEEVLNNLITIAEDKADHIIAYIKERKKSVTVLIHTQHIIGSFDKFTTAFKFGTESSEYKAVKEPFGAEISRHKEIYGYYDIFLISPEGDIVFTVNHEADFGTNLRTGPYKDTELAKVFYRAHTLLETEISDFQRYAPSGNEATAFIAAPVIHEGKLLGIFAVQLNTKEINQLAQNFTGLGKTGEIVIASHKDDHALFLTPTRHDPEAAFNRKVMLGSEKASPIQQAINGKKGAGLSHDYLNQEVIAVWRYLPHLRWGIVVKINTAEAFIPIFKLARLFLIVGFLTVFGVVLLALLVSKTISRPIVSLTRATKLIAAGDLTVKVEIESNDEIGLLAQCFNDMITEREQAEIKLRLAKEATEEANQKITALNEQLHSENLRLGCELNVAYQIQQMLLPSKKELQQIEDLDIACFMKPADEVGGDYYDVFYQNGQVLIGIGDVTGHGLESGVLAIMVQSAVRTLLAATSHELDSVKFFSALNQMVYHNVIRMNAEKSLTLVLLSIQNGQLTLTGQHEEMIVVRKGKLELIDTVDLGFPIGLDEEIGDFVNQAIVPLNAGDVVVLYTDGITEAINSDKVEYGLERLCEVVKQNWQRTADEIRQVVIDDVWQHIGTQKIFDDITLLVLKQKRVVYSVP
jgi:serine phosphatase RsbU (regulator of sigma subunit)